jgi:hypothetical protein
MFFHSNIFSNFSLLNLSCCDKLLSKLEVPKGLLRGRGLFKRNKQEQQKAKNNKLERKLKHSDRRLRCLEQQYRQAQKDQEDIKQLLSKAKEETKDM